MFVDKRDSAEVSVAIVAKIRVNLGTPTWRTSIPVVAINTAMSRASMRLLCPT